MVKNLAMHDKEAIAIVCIPTVLQIWCLLRFFLYIFPETLINKLHNSTTQYKLRLWFT